MTSNFFDQLARVPSGRSFSAGKSAAFVRVFRHKLDKNEYAVKAVKLSGNTSQAFERELLHVMGLSHPNIIRYYDCCKEQES